MEKLTDKLKKEIVDYLNLEDINPENIDDHEPLFGNGVGLDSIDALELIVLLEKNYGIRIENAEEGQKVFRSISSMAEYINSKK